MADDFDNLNTLGPEKPSPKADVEYPELLNDIYEVGEKVGEGGMGVVFRCRDRRNGNELAVKFLSRELREKEASRQRFDHEVQILSGLRHPNIVAVRAHGIEDGFPYLIMDLCLDYAGKPLTIGLVQRRSPDNRLRATQLLELLAPLLASVGYLHGQGLVHRDLKPANVLLQAGAGGKLFPKLSDFGLVSLTSDEELRTRYEASVNLTVYDGGDKQRALAGTWDYMSPEQRKGGAIDARSDVYSLGRIIYLLATGYTRTRPEYPSEVNPELPEWLNGFLKRAMQRNPADRYHAAQEMYEDLPKDLRQAHVDWLRERGHGNWWQRLRRRALLPETRQRQRRVAAIGSIAMAACPKCGASLEIPSELAGTGVKCPECGHEWRSLGPATPIPARPPVAEPAASARPLRAGKVQQLPYIAVLLALQGAIESALALLMMAAMHDDMESVSGTIVMAIYCGLIFACGVLKVVVGIRNYHWKSWHLGVLALSTSIVSLGTCFCAPTALVLTIYGFIVYFDPHVRRAFQDRAPTVG